MGPFFDVWRVKEGEVILALPRPWVPSSSGPGSQRPKVRESIGFSSCVNSNQKVTKKRTEKRCKNPQTVGRKFESTFCKKKRTIMEFRGAQLVTCSKSSLHDHPITKEKQKKEKRRGGAGEGKRKNQKKGGRGKKKREKKNKKKHKNDKRKKERKKEKVKEGKQQK